MNLIKTIDQYNEDCVYFCDPIKNNIMNEGIFIRIIYSNSLFMLNGIYLSLFINHMNIEKYYNKYKCRFDVNDYKLVIEQLKRIEEGLLKKVSIRNKTPQYKLNEQLRYGQLKIFYDTTNVTATNSVTDNAFLLKISGIWETDMHYGLTFKFIKV